MNSTTKSQSIPMFESIIQNLTKHPRNLVLFVMVLFGFFFSATGIMMGLFLLWLSFLMRFPVWIAGLLGVILILGSYLLAGVGVVSIYHQNSFLFSSLFSGDNSPLKSPFIWLSSLPYGLVLGCLLTAISKFDLGLIGELDRVSQGKKATPRRELSKRKLAARLDHLKSAAYAAGTILGIDRYRGHYVELTDVDANLHTLAIGTTGSGKTTGIANIIESAIVRKHPLFYIDGKGDFDLAKRVERFAQSRDTKFYLFSMTGKSLKYNPIAFGGFTSKKDRIVELRKWSEDHYRKIAEGYLQTVFKLLERAEITLDLTTLAKYMEPDALYLLARNLNDESLAKEIEQLESRRKDITSLIAEIENIANSEMGHLFDCSSGEVITLDKALSENAVVYFCLQPLAFPAYAETLGKLIINDIKSLVASLLTKSEKIKLFTIFDEFSVFAGDQIINLINQGRGAGVHAVLSTQSLSDILRKGDDALLGQVLNNTNNYIIQRQNNPDDAEVLSNIVGTEVGFQITSQVSVDQCSAAGSIREAREFIIHPDEIKRLTLGQAIFVNKQQFKVQKILLRKGWI